MNLIYSLPCNLISKIYEYDNTYKQIFDLVLLEMIIVFRYIGNLNIIYNRHHNFINTFYQFAENEIIELFRPMHLLH
jgi:hypothetical protein